MKKAILLFALTLALCGSTYATTYYIAANGNDTTHNGTSETTPWLHAPGMPNCAGSSAGTCGGTTVNAGDSVIFRGGDTWHFGNASAVPYAGGTWFIFTFPGSAANCQLDLTVGAIKTSSCVYWGVDKTWFTGASWVRPAMNLDNPLSTSYGTCMYNDDNFNAVRIGNYTIVDNFEFLGICYGISPNAGLLRLPGTDIEVENSYFHGWTLDTAAVDDYAMIGAESFGGFSTGFVLTYQNIYDGTDSSSGNVASTATGSALAFACGEISHSVFRKLINGCKDGGGTVSGIKSIHDNLFQDLYNNGAMGSGNHGQIIEELNPGQATTYFYNNTALNVNDGEGVNLYPASSGTVYIFNNIMNNNSHSCFLFGFGSPATGVSNWFVTNNTFDSTCQIASSGLTTGNSNVTYQNNHFIGYSPATLSTVGPTAATQIDNGSEVFQTSASATSQGYTATNNYQPTLGTNSTIHAGANLSGSCGTYSVDSALCNGSSAGVTSTASSGILGATLVPSPPSRSTTFDAGAYQFNSGIVATPSICIGAFCAGGAFSSPQTIVITTSTGGATICYTVDGSTPTASAGSCTHGTTYSTSFSQSIAGPGVTVQAIGTLSGLSNSSITSNTYTLLSVGNGVTGGTSIIGGGILVK